jgi:hypothetical protein
MNIEVKPKVTMIIMIITVIISTRMRDCAHTHVPDKNISLFLG